MENTTKNLQQRKNDARAIVMDLGFIAKDKTNANQGYAYLSEAGYKKIAVELLSKCGIEFKASTLSIEKFQGTDKQPFGRSVLMEFTLINIDNPEDREISQFTGEGIDNGDKAIYKAYTGALKYFLAETFHLPTNDEPENDQNKPGKTQQPKSAKYDNKKPVATKPGLIVEWQKNLIVSQYKTELQKLLDKYNLTTIDEMLESDAQAIIQKLKEISAKKNA